ncbi:MAG: sulfatase, partial [Candidatus Omnitrophica bacterium]|nr:sulfatase [Candidatus Omnitrophota bacterium]
MKYLFIYFSALFLLFSPLFVEGAPVKTFKDYNVILFFVDTLRADHLGCYGYPKATSPNIDKLAGESFVFKENFSTASFTFPSFTSINTSLYPNSHGVYMAFKDKLSPRASTLAEILNMYGYKTAWLGPLNDPHLDLLAGFGRGFDEFIGQSSSYDVKKKKVIFLNWLEENRGKKFFFNAHTYKMHSPYFPSPEYKERFTKIKSMKGVIDNEDSLLERTCEILREGQRGRDIVDRFLGKELYDEFSASGLLNADAQRIISFFNVSEKKYKIAPLKNFAYWREIDLSDPAVNAYVQSLYDACIREYDEEVIGPVIEKLKDLRIYDKTIIIICSDHGEEFYEHGKHGHGLTLYGEATHVPLIIRVPRVKRGKGIKELTQTVDIMPTLLDLLGIPIPHQAQGKSLAGLMNKRTNAHPQKYVFGKLQIISSIRSKEWLFLLNNDSQKRELYHLYSDPREQKNVYPENKDAALKLESELKKWEASLPSYQDKEYPFDPGIDEA